MFQYLLFFLQEGDTLCPRKVTRIEVNPNEEDGFEEDVTGEEDEDV